MKYEANVVPAAEAEPEVVRLWDERAARPNGVVFRWGYLSNPIGAGHCFLLHAIDGGRSSIVGTVGIGTRRVSMGGQTLNAGVLGDFFVVKAHRTFFPALSMQRAVLTWARKNLDLVYGFPNELARPVIKRLGFREMAHFQRHVLVLRHAPYLFNRLGVTTSRLLAAPIDGFRRVVHPGISRGPTRGLRFERIQKIDERFDRLFEARAFRSLTVGYRDAKLLHWRFIDYPGQPCEVYGLTEGSGELRAYVVIQLTGDIAHVRDLLGVDVEAMGEALRLIAGVARSREFVSLSFACSAPPELQRALDRLGFRTRKSAEGPRVLFGHAGDQLLAEREKGKNLSALDRWYATEVDEDQ